MLTSQLVSPINTDHEIFFEEVRQFYLSLKSFQTTKIGIYFGVLLKCYCIIKFVYVYQVTPNLTWIGISFFSRSLLYYILIIMRYEHWKCNNICNIGKIKKGKTENLNVVYLLKHIRGYF